MNGIIYYSNTNQSKAVAEYLVNEIGWDLYDLNDCEQTQKAAEATFERIVLIFPVYCQNAPDVVKDFLKKLKTRYLTLIATYGKMCYGRALYEIQQSYKDGEIIAAAYVPMKHSYLQEKTETNLEALSLVVQKTLNDDPQPIIIKKTYKNPFASVGKDMRSRMLVKIVFDKEKCTNCKKCERECLFNGIVNGKVNSNCIRCLKCATNCPAGAISFNNSFFLSIYLKKKPMNNFEIYI